MSKFSKDVINRIKKEDAKPISKWLFVTKHALVLICFFLLTVFASFIFSLILFRFDDLDFDIDPQWEGFSVIYAFPYLWLILVLIAIVGAYFYFKQTPHGYRYRLITILVMLIAVVGTVGAVGYLSKFPKFFDDAIQDSPLYKYFNYDKFAQWTRPGEGFLSGEITKVNSDGGVLLKDFNGKDWDMDVSKATIIDKGVKIKVGQEVKVLGDEISEIDDGDGGNWNFEAEEIRSWDHSEEEAENESRSESESKSGPDDESESRTEPSESESDD
jgi:hypothetical protein